MNTKLQSRRWKRRPVGGIEIGKQPAMRVLRGKSYNVLAADIPQKFQDIEEERLDFTKSSLWTFANIASTVCVSDDAVREPVGLA